MKKWVKVYILRVVSLTSSLAIYICTHKVWINHQDSLTHHTIICMCGDTHFPIHIQLHKSTLFCFLMTKFLLRKCTRRQLSICTYVGVESMYYISLWSPYMQNVVSWSLPYLVECYVLWASGSECFRVFRITWWHMRIWYGRTCQT